MAIFKCKMCGGTIEFNKGDTVGICDSCGTKQTLPRLDDDKKANLYDRANHFRRNNDYDKAMGIYEQILNEDNTDSEAYWSLVLCRYGIEYVEDPSTHKRVPTVNRAQLTSIFDDDNYKQALHYADSSQRVIYEQEATVINEIQKGILAISQKEEPFDVFICYKETDNNGRRTQDSVLANDLYHQLAQEGFKVFFSRITLEDKLGTAYEPYIFAALNSAKVMVVIGTRPENFNAVWVKNEWSRFLALVKNDSSKVLIPAYRDMDPYDLPEEFSHLQAQDMSKLGFMQDLIRGIKKITDGNTGVSKSVNKEAGTGNNNTDSLLKRVFMFLEDGNWSEADAYCEKVLDIEPENAEAYLGKLMAECRVAKKEKLADLMKSIKDRNNFIKAVRFGDDKLKAELNRYEEAIENNRKQGIYDRAKEMMQAASSQEEYEAAAGEFERILDFKDSKALAGECYKKAEACQKDKIYEDAILLMNKNTISDYEEAIKIFHGISDWKDADSQIDVCQKKIEEIQAKEESDRLEQERREEADRISKEKAKAKKIKMIKIAIPIACACIAFVIVWQQVIVPNNKYKAAEELMNAGEFMKAYEAFTALDDYKDSAKKASATYAGYEADCADDEVMNIKSTAKVGGSVYFGAYEQDNDTSNGKESIEWRVLEVKKDKVLLISKDALDCQSYDASDIDCSTWENCEIRKWLNNDFLNAAFSDAEKSKIPTVKVSADKNPKYDVDPGNDTEDQIFLLSFKESKKYFSSDSARRCRPTSYAENKGVYKYIHKEEYDYYGNCRWWLRTHGVGFYKYGSLSVESNNAACIGFDGEVDLFGEAAVSSDPGVRPALWVNIE